MAFTIQNYSKTMNKSTAGRLNANEHTYSHATDTLAQILTAGYFNDVREHFTIGDRIIINSIASSGGGQTWAKVTAIGANLVLASGSAI